jgi:carbon storage regulator CsrA
MQRELQMLVLVRKPGESVTVDGVGTLKCLSVCGNKIRLGFDFDPSIQVRRSEVEPPTEPTVPDRKAA